MTKKKKEICVPSWSEIENRVIEAFDLDDVGSNYGVSRWREHVEKQRCRESTGEITHYFTNPKVLDATFELFKSDIEEEVAIYRAIVARSKREQRFMDLSVILGENQGVFTDKERGERVIPELLAIVRISKNKMMQQIVQASMSLAQNSADDSGEQPLWPVEVSDEFTKDLTEFVEENGEKGREIVKHVCKDTAYAKKVCDDEEMPEPIRYLAQVVVKVSTTNQIPKAERAIGFGLSGRQNELKQGRV